MSGNQQDQGLAAAVASIELPPPPDPDPYSDPISLAIVAEVGERGYETTTPIGVVRRARVTLDEFNNRFESLDACALDTLERLIADFKRRVGRAFNGQAEWSAALRAAAYEVADWMEQFPAQAAFGVAEVLKMRPELLRVRREQAFEFCAELIDRGRTAAPDPDAVPDSAPIVAVGAIVQLATHRLQEGAEIRPYDVIPELMHRVVSVYLGPEAAEVEWTAERPPTVS